MSREDVSHCQEIPSFSIELTLGADGSYKLIERQAKLGDIKSGAGTQIQIGFDTMTREYEGAYEVGERSDDNPNEVLLRFNEAGYMGFFDEGDCSLRMQGIYPDALLQYACEREVEGEPGSDSM